MVGGRTSVRFLNSPRSMQWAGEVAKLRGSKEQRYAKVPPELKNNDHVVVWGSDNTRQRLANALPDGASVVRANTAVRKHCAAKPFWHADELAAHQRGGARIFQITFGFEAVAHALFACDRVKIYGYYLGDIPPPTNVRGSAAMERHATTARTGRTTRRPRTRGSRGRSPTTTSRWSTPSTSSCTTRALADERPPEEVIQECLTGFLFVIAHRARDGEGKLGVRLGQMLDALCRARKERG